jgi:hypothetical protein
MTSPGGPIIIGGNSPTIDGIFSLGPATNERQPAVWALNDVMIHAHLTGDAAGSRCVGIEFAIDTDEGENSFVYLDAGNAELLAQHLMAAAEKTHYEEQK